MISFIQNQKALVERMRLNLWNKSKHPDRWTNQDLLSDTRKADSLEGLNGYARQIQELV
jgi:hypothetical protein